MKHLPEKAEVNILITKTKRMTLELDADQVQQIIREWAGSRGFSSRAIVTLYAFEDTPHGAEISEEISKSWDPGK